MQLRNFLSLEFGTKCQRGNDHTHILEIPEFLTRSAILIELRLVTDRQTHDDSYRASVASRGKKKHLTGTTTRNRSLDIGHRYVEHDDYRLFFSFWYVNHSEVEVDCGWRRVNVLAVSVRWSLADMPLWSLMGRFIFLRSCDPRPRIRLPTANCWSIALHGRRMHSLQRLCPYFVNVAFLISSTDD